MATTTQVTSAFSLGWHIAELYHFQRLPGETERGGPDSLPGIGRLSRMDRAKLLAMQVETASGNLGQKDPEILKVTQQLEREQIDVAALKEVVKALHERLLKTLTATDPGLGTAFGLGRALAETMLVPSTDVPSSFFHEFDRYRITTLQADLADLKAALPPYSAEAVQSTLSAWSSWVAAENLGEVGAEWTTGRKQHVGQSIRRQGEIWYGLLTGEIDPLQTLRSEDYVQAAESLLKCIGELSWSFLTSNWIGRILAIIALGVSALLAAVSITGHLAAVTGTAVLLLGALGITAGSIVTAVRQALRQAQIPLWEAELTSGVAAATLRLPILTAVEADVEMREESREPGTGSHVGNQVQTSRSNSE